MKIALLYTEQSRLQKDLGRMITHLSGVLKEVDGVEVDEKVLAVGTNISYPEYSHLVFCGYDFTTLGNLWLAMASTDPDTVRITLYDEPGATLDRELNAIIFRGIDSRRMPGSSATRLTHSWSHRDLVSIARQGVIKYGGGVRPDQPTAELVSSESRSRNGSRNTRTREVDAKGKAQAREGNETSGGTETT